MSPAGSRLSWLWRAPVRALGRARDYYVRSIMGCAGSFPADAAFGGYTGVVPMAAPLARSHSCSAGSDWSGASEEDFRELIRASSRRDRQQVVQAVPRSQSTAVGRSMAPIAEDAPCEFAGARVGSLYSKSQSYASGSAGRPRFHRKEAVLV